jgi:DNA-binding NarL/FixJ family response regulator
VASELRVVVGEDDVLFRAGICRVLEDAGIEIVAQTGNADDLLRRALAYRPDVTVTDVQMPPRNEDDGLRAALELRRQRPESRILVLSQHAEQQYALDLVGHQPAGVGYLLKERVGDVETFIDAVERVARGGTALDAEVVALMLGRRRPDDPLDNLTPRERDVLAAMAQGKSNRGIAAELLISEAAVEKYTTSIFGKLKLDPSPNEHRRVLAALKYLSATR